MVPLPKCFGSNGFLYGFVRAGVLCFSLLFFIGAHNTVVVSWENFPAPFRLTFDTGVYKKSNLLFLFLLFSSLVDRDDYCLFI